LEVRLMITRSSFDLLFFFFSFLFFLLFGAVRHQRITKQAATRIRTTPD
jgi:hypothetical protein